MNNNFLPYQLKKSSQQNTTMANEIGTLSSLQTADKTNLVNAINSNVTSLAQNTQHRMNWINVVQNGVKNDGTDCTSALSSLMSANPGSVFYFPKGTYLLSSTLPYITSNTALIGETGTIIYLSSSYVNDGLNCLFRTAGYNDLTKTTPVTNVVVKDIQFISQWQSTTAEGPYFLGYWYVQNFLIDNCTFSCPTTSVSGDTVDIRGGCAYGVIRKCFFENLGQIKNPPATGGSIMIRNFSNDDNHHLVITECRFHKIGVDETLWIGMSGSAPNQNVQSRDIIITNNHFICDAGSTGNTSTSQPDVFITLGTGVKMNNIVFANNDIICYQVNRSVIRCGGDNVNVFNNNIQYTNGGGTSDMVIECVNSAAGRVNIKGNTIIATNPSIGISLSNSDVLVQNNTLIMTGSSTSSAISGTETYGNVRNNYINMTTGTNIFINVLRVMENQVVLSGVTNICQNVKDLVGNHVTCSTSPTFIWANFKTTIDNVTIKRNVIKGMTSNGTIRSNTNALQRISICDNEFDYAQFSIASMTLAVVINNILFNTPLNSGNITTEIAATTLVFKNNLAGGSYLSV